MWHVVGDRCYIQLLESPIPTLSVCDEKAVLIITIAGARRWLSEFWLRLIKADDDYDDFSSNESKMHCCVGHTAWAPEGREGRSQAGPKGP